MSDERCCAVVGNVMTGPGYCGRPAKKADLNGRPVCGIHRSGQPGIEWFGDRYRYPQGKGGEWKFHHGEPRQP